MRERPETRTHTHTDTHAVTQSHRHTHTQSHTHAVTQSHRHTDTQTHRHRHTHTHTDRHTHTQTARHTDTYTRLFSPIVVVGLVRLLGEDEWIAHIHLCVSHYEAQACAYRRMQISQPYPPQRQHHNNSPQKQTTRFSLASPFCSCSHPFSPAATTALHYCCSSRNEAGRCACGCPCGCHHRCCWV